MVSYKTTFFKQKACLPSLGFYSGLRSDLDPIYVELGRIRRFFSVFPLVYHLFSKRMQRKKIYVNYTSILLYKMGHYFLDRQYVQEVLCVQEVVTTIWTMDIQQLPIFYSNLFYIMGNYFLDIQYYLLLHFLGRAIGRGQRVFL